MRILFAVYCCLIVFPGLSQEQTGSLYFTETIYDFGTLSEDAAPPTHIFTFINRGNSPVWVREVRSLCFCAVPEFPRRPVLPGQTGEIKVTFKPKGHPGKFNKRIIVVTTEQPDGLNLRIKGNVLPGKPAVYPSYPYRIGDLKLKNTICRFGPVCIGKRREERIAVVNTGARALAVEFQDVPAYLSCTLEPLPLQPGQEGDIVIVYCAVGVQPEGVHSDTIRLQLPIPAFSPLDISSIVVSLDIQGSIPVGGTYIF